ncbi:ABC transporter substrate-binding protein [Limobrevibacterium gyesilva]|uniref:ABC transporter substrate-binding protein n=1 Tax=Limobrevibacterium gyesilva TaxID=2991712 RepID=A0AA41YKK2_9PROT|nr:ABC transporter substrate-binding protein [Limobrevibacterium gyesilva]MCW3475029.1 ABC transporter substrate-binding protein [Limobrevibacterium gyesilva]
MHRRTLLAGAGAALLAAPAIAQPARARTLRMVPQTSLTALDPVWTTASVTSAHGYAVFDTLYSVDSNLRPQPQMAEGHDVSADGRVWQIRLRDGLKFHDGEAVRAADCVASLVRWSKRDSFGQTLARFVDAWEAADDRTIRIRLNRPFAPLLDAIAKPASVVAFIMPERLAKTDANTAITEMVGSGPFRFLKDEFVAGSRVAYARFEGYVPRQEPANFMAGGKRAFFDRIEWQIIPDPATAAGALRNNEVDWWELAHPDLIPLFARDSGVKVTQVDDLGFISILRFNALVPPFNNPKLRAAVLAAVDQADYMRAVNGENVRWHNCAAMFPCGIPFVKELGAGVMNQPRDLARARAAIRAAGYGGERVVVMNPADFPSIAPLGEVTADLLKQLGMNVDLQQMDWGTLGQRRTSKAGVDAGGWNIFHTWTNSVSITNPALNYYVRGQGQAGWFGWYENAEVERLTDAWSQAATDAEKQVIFDAIQRQAFETAPIIPLGQYYPATAHRSNIVDRIPATNPLPWNIRRA